MPNIQELESSLSSRGRRTFNTAVSIMRKVGSSTLHQETVILALAQDDEIGEVFERHGAGSTALLRLFGVDPAQPESSGSFNITAELAELVKHAATSPVDRRQIKAGTFELVDSFMNHPMGRLRDYLVHAKMASTHTFDEQTPELFWQDIDSIRRRAPRLSIVA